MKAVQLGEIDMSGDIDNISLKKDYSRIYIEWGNGEDTFERPIGRVCDKTDWNLFNWYNSRGYDAMLWYGEFTMTEFVKLLVEYSDLGYYQLKNKCKAIVKGSKPEVTIHFGSDKLDPMRFGGTVYISDPVLAQAIIDSYN